MNEIDDRELLELAAKAAGYVDSVTEQTGWHGFIGLRVCDEYGHWDDWSPLTSDGEALRLAVKLGIDVLQDAEVSEVSTAYSLPGPFGYNTLEDYGQDPCAATRRAIVRAAAEIGKALP